MVQPRYVPTCLSNYKRLAYKSVILWEYVITGRGRAPLLWKTLGENEQIGK